MFKRALGDDYEYVEAHDGMQGLELYALNRPDLVILDVTMPGNNGMEVLERLRQMDPAARVIIGTADLQESTWQIAKGLGAAAVINKPFWAENVQVVVRAVLNGGEEDRGS
jgi:two-component system chemotaxis response regulator CheY